LKFFFTVFYEFNCLIFSIFRAGVGFQIVFNFFIYETFCLLDKILLFNHLSVKLWLISLLICFFKLFDLYLIASSHFYCFKKLNCYSYSYPWNFGTSEVAVLWEKHESSHFYFHYFEDNFFACLEKLNQSLFFLRAILACIAFLDVNDRSFFLRSDFYPIFWHSCFGMMHRCLNFFSLHLSLFFF
jgi:hypothetical protein